jgi:hypothetical protein
MRRMRFALDPQEPVGPLYNHMDDLAVALHVRCQSCGRKHQLRANGYSGAFGWWGIPFGLIITPIQIMRNFLDMMRHASQPSASFIRITPTHLAERVAAAKRARA